jgi:hypothetical protein
MKTLDWSVETLGLDYNSTGLCNHLFKPRVASETWLIYQVAVNEQIVVLIKINFTRDEKEWSRIKKELKHV